jgi:hypothetical protein
MRRSQISIFILVALGILFAVGIFFFTQSSTQTQVVSPELLPVKTYMESCLQTIAQDGLEKLGSQGGYIYPRFSVNTVSPTDSAGFAPFGQKTALPYWYYLSSSNKCESNCQFSSAMPELITGTTSIKAQLEQYISAQLLSCGSPESYTVNASELPQTTVTIRDNDVFVEVTYPLDVSFANSVQKIEQFQTTLDVPLKQLYEYAVLITLTQQELRFLENLAIELISLSSGMDNQKLPPMVGSHFNFANSYFWIKSTVAKQLQELLTVYVGALQVVGSQTYQPLPSSISNEPVAKIYQRLHIPLLEFAEKKQLKDQLANYAVSFDYLDYPVYFAVNAKGQLIKPNSFVMGLFPFFGIHQQQTYYDISFPVRVGLSADKALGGKGYTFSFGLEANIRDNEPLTSSYVRFAGQSDEGGFIFEEQKNSAPVSVLVLDGTDAPVVDAALTYICGDATAVIGVTDSQGYFSGPFPICMGGTLTVQKFGYSTKSQILSTSLELPKSVSVVLDQFKDITLSLKQRLLVYDVSTKRWVAQSGVSDIFPTQSVTMQFEQVDGDHSAFAVIDALKPIQSDVVVSLVPGVYKVSTQIIDSQPFSIEQKTRKVKAGLFKKKTITVPGLHFDQVPHGSYTLDGVETPYFTITADDLYGHSQLDIVAVTAHLQDVPVAQREIELIAILSNLTAYQSDQPVWSKDVTVVPSARQSYFMLQKIPARVFAGSTVAIEARSSKDVQYQLVLPTPTQPITQLIHSYAIPVSMEKLGPLVIEAQVTYPNKTTTAVRKQTYVVSKGVLTDIKLEVPLLKLGGQGDTFTITGLFDDFEQYRVIPFDYPGLSIEYDETTLDLQNNTIVALKEGQTSISVTLDEKSVVSDLTITR